MTPVAHQEAINLNSLSVIREQLMATIEQASVQLEGFVGDQTNINMLQSCVDLLEQIRGSLDVVQLYGASELASEILDSANGMISGDLPPSEEGLSSLTRSFFVLSRYFEYVLQSQRAMPTLLIPYINDIRVVYSKPLMPESYFFEVDINRFKTVKESDTAIEDDRELVAVIGRLRHMYQVGLLGLFKQASVKPSLNLMLRAVARIAQLTEGYKTGTFWWVAAAAISLFDEAELEATRERKRNFGQIDRQLKQLLNDGKAQFDQPPPNELLQDLIYYTALSGVDNDTNRAVQAVYNYQPLSYSEAERQREQRALIGPNANTVSSLVSTLQEELRAVKDIVETESEKDAPMVESYHDIVDRITKIKDILNVVGLETASLTMDQQLNNLKQWQQSDQTDRSSQLLEIADAILYVETTLNDLEKMSFGDEKLDGLDDSSRREIIVSSQLAEAQLVVFQEVEAGLLMIKKALNAFSDSDFNTDHIKEVPVTLESIRGGMILLDLPRAAAIISSCVQFMEKSLFTDNQPSALGHMLNTFADALSGLEYYMECLKVDANADDDVLVIAEDSLAALGYSVDQIDT